MLPRSLRIPALAVIAAAAPAFADTFTETFDGGSNTGSWLYGGPGEVIESSGGNPGAFLHSPTLDTFAPQPRTTPGVASVFTGDYRGRNVTGIGVDLATIDVDFSAADRPLTLLLVTDNGTPADASDDWAAYFIGPTNVPVPGEGWRSFSFGVPSQSATLPPGWQTLAFGPNSPQSPDWNALVTDVSQIGFFYGDPTFFFIFQVWNVGLDNVSISGDVVPVELLHLEVE